MGNSFGRGSVRTSYDNDALGATSTAREVYEHFLPEGSDPTTWLQGRTAIVTGGNSGIGLETVKILAYGGAKVLLCSRSVAAGEAAVKEEINGLGHGGYVVPKERTDKNIKVYALDLSSLASIREFAEKALADTTRIDYLILNAGIMALPSRETSHNGAFEKQIGVNHFGHFYLMKLLRNRMETQTYSQPTSSTPQAPPAFSRVVVLTSTAHTMGSVDPTDLHFNKHRTYSGWVSYGQSKLANLLFAKELADQVYVAHKPIAVMAVHPGVIQTNLWRSTGVASGVGAWVLSHFISDKTIPQGASTTAWAMFNPYVEAELTPNLSSSAPTTSSGINASAVNEVGKLPIHGAYLLDCAPTLPNGEGQDVTPITNTTSGTETSMRRWLWEVSDAQLDEAVAAERK